MSRRHPEIFKHLQREISNSVRLGVLPKPVTLSPRYVDLSLIADAKKRLDSGE